MLLTKSKIYEKNIIKFEINCSWYNKDLTYTHVNFLRKNLILYTLYKHVDEKIHDIGPFFDGYSLNTIDILLLLEKIDNDYGITRAVERNYISLMQYFISQGEINFTYAALWVDDKKIQDYLTKEWEKLPKTEDEIIMDEILRKMMLE